MTETIAQRLKRLLEEARMAGLKVSAKSLSLSVGGAETYVGDILRGRVKNPSMVKLSRIARTLGIPLERLVPDEDREIPSGAYLELRERVEDFRHGGSDPAGKYPILDPEALAVILAALPLAVQRLGHKPSAEHTSDAIYRAHGWMRDEAAAGRYSGPDAVVNFLSHIL